MLDPQAGEEQRQQLAADAKARLESEGALNHSSSWGLRKMAYEIDQRTEADYHCFRFSGEKPLLDELNHALRITDGILRFRIFAVDPQSPVIVPPDTEQIMRRDDDEERGRGRGRRDDRGPRRPRREEGAAATPAEGGAEADPATDPAAAS